MNPNGKAGLEPCAMVACGLPAAAVPLVVDVAGMPGPFEIPLCTFCREPFEAGLEAVERLVWGDPEAVPFGAPGGREALELER